MESKSVSRIAVTALCVLSRLALGGTLVFSGFVKASDPMGMAHKFYAYCSALGVTATDGSLPLQVAASAVGVLEFATGVYLLLAARRRLTTTVVALMMAFFTAVTVWTYVSNPVADCGCFGDAVTLTPGQTLAKNVVLLSFAVLLLVRSEGMQRVVSERNSWLVTVYSWVYAVGLCLYTLHYQPVVEYTPYAPGARLRAALSGQLDASTRESRLANFYVEDTTTGEDLSLAIAEDTGYTFLLAVPDAATADDGCGDRVNDIADFCRDTGAKFYMATASPKADVSGWRDRTGAAYPVLAADRTELNTMTRSNPGLLLFKDGRLAAKWGKNNLPDPETAGGSPARWAADSGGAGLPALVLWFVVPCLAVIVLDALWRGSKYYNQRTRNNRFNPYKDKMRKKIVAGNWKMNKNLQEGVALAKELNEALTADKPNCGVVICTPYIHLASVAAVLDQSIIGLGAENCADKEKGAYTGEVSAEMVKSTGAGYVILGHSERRAYYHETPEILREKVNLALANGLEVIFCIGEVLEEREANKQNDVVKAQLEGSLFGLTAEQFAHIVLAYEPVWAIGTGKTATADQAEEMHAFIRSTIADKFGAEAAENVTILYGGSCKPSNAKELFSKPDVDGGLIGGAALKADDFKGIIDAWK